MGAFGQYADLGVLTVSVKQRGDRFFDAVAWFEQGGFDLQVGQIVTTDVHLSLKLDLGLNLGLTLILLDVDHFKEINDQYGHELGDAALVHLCKLLQGVLRETDLLARLSGVEFVILLPNTDIEGAGMLAERMLERAHGHPLLSGDLEIPVLFSAGVVAMRGEEDLDDMLARADHAMAKAKAKGRACIIADTEVDCEAG